MSTIHVISAVIGRTLSQRLWRLLITLVILFIMVTVYGYHKRRLEGFHQEQGTFIIKRGNDRYDDYYANVYNRIYEPIVTAQQVAEFMTSFTKSSPAASSILDVGAGTGELMNYLQHTRGYPNVYGIESSTDMISYALTQYPSLQIKHGNILQPMSYDGSTFTHILCIGTHNVLYHLPIEQKKIFLANCYHWLIANHGYLILQLYERDEASPIPACGVSTLIGHPQQLSDTRITQTTIKFHDFQYESNYDFGMAKDKTSVTVTEEFTDNHRNVRKNEFELHIDSIETVLRIAKQVGFVIRGQVDVETDNGQHLYLLEKIQHV